MTDDEFAAAFERCEIANSDFHHRDHIRLAWFYLRRYGAEAEPRIAASIRNFAAHNGHSERYHHTITIAWMRLVAPAARWPAFGDAIAAHPHLLDKNYLGEFYSDALLASPAAKAAFIEPDKKPFDVLK